MVLIPRSGRLALLRLRRRPWFVAGIALPLSLAVGCTAAMFAIVDHLLLMPPSGVTDASRLVQVTAVSPAGTAGALFPQGLSLPAYRDVQHALIPLPTAAFGRVDGDLHDRMGHARRVPVELVSGNYFAALGVTPAIGRLLAGEDLTKPDAPAEIVLTGDFWRQEFGRDHDVVGRRIELGGGSFVVVGVAGHDFTGLGIDPPIGWVPIGRASNLGIPNSAAQSALFTWLTVIARTDGTHTLAALTATLESYRLRNGSSSTAWRERGLPEPSFHVAALRRTIGQRAVTIERMTAWLFALSLTLLMIACANTAILLLARFLSSSREWSTKLALGASRADVVSELVVEGAFLALLSSGVGLAVCSGIVHLSRRLPGVSQVTIHNGWFVTATIAFTILIFVATTLPVAVVSNSGSAGRAGRGVAGIRRSSVLRVLQAAQAALVLVLAVGAKMLVQNLHTAARMDLGFARDNLIWIEATTANDPSSPGAFRASLGYSQAVKDRLIGMPGIMDIAVSTSIPLRGGTAFFVAPPGVASGGAVQAIEIPGNSVDERYFGTMGMRIIAGRAFTREDRNGSPLVAVVNRTFAEKYWPHDVAVGKCISATANRCNLRVIGVVEDAIYRHLNEVTPPFVYRALAQTDAGAPAVLNIRTKGAAVAMLNSVRKAMVDIPAPSNVSIRPVSALIDAQIRPWMVAAHVLTLFGGLALILVFSGVYSTARLVAAVQRQNIAVRLAVGATRRDIVVFILKPEVRTASIGLIVGAALSWPLAAWLAHSLELLDLGRASAIAVGAVAVFAAILLGSAQPAVWASKVDIRRALENG